LIDKFRRWPIVVLAVAIAAVIAWPADLIDNVRALGADLKQLFTSDSDRAEEVVKNIRVGASAEYLASILGPPRTRFSESGFRMAVYGKAKVIVLVKFDAQGVARMVVFQVCDPQIQVKVDRVLPDLGAVTLNKDRFSDVQQDLPSRALYNTPIDNPASRIEYSDLIGPDRGVGEVWGVGSACDSSWQGVGNEPPLDWGGAAEKPVDSPFPVSASGLERFRQGKVVNLYGQSDTFPVETDGAPRATVPPDLRRK
jgi:hypothetical protein